MAVKDVEFATKIGELIGSQQAVLSELGRLNSELVTLRKEMDQRHAENLREIQKRHDENLAIIADHKEEDEQNFRKIFRWMNYTSGAIGLMVVLWGIFKLVLPFLLKVNLGE